MADERIVNQLPEMLGEAFASIRAKISGLGLGGTELATEAAAVYWRYEHLPESWVLNMFGVTEHDLREAFQWEWATVRCARCFGRVSIGLVAHGAMVSDAAPPEGHPVILCGACWDRLRGADFAESAILEEKKRAKAIRVAELRAMPYTDYLTTDHWQTKRKEALERDGHACRVCGSTESLNVHHQTYERRGEEDPNDLVTLCQPCHQVFHENGKLVKATEAPAVEGPSF